MRIIRFALLACLATSALAQTTPAYEVFAIRYATLPQFPLNALVKGAETTKIDVPCYVWLVRGGGKNILVDSGFYRPQFMKQWKPADYIRPDEAVARAGASRRATSPTSSSRMRTGIISTERISSLTLSSGSSATSTSTTRPTPGRAAASMAASTPRISRSS